MDTASEELLRLVQCFDKHHVAYIVVGGLAVNHYGFKRTTGDVDIYLKDNIENRQGLIDALEEMGYGRFEQLLRVPIIAGYCEIMMDDGIYADLLTELPGLPKQDFDAQYEMANVGLISDIPVRFLSYHHLIANKLATGRPKDLADVAELQKLHDTPNS